MPRTLTWSIFVRFGHVIHENGLEFGAESSYEVRFELWELFIFPNFSVTHGQWLSSKQAKPSKGRQYQIKPSPAIPANTKLFSYIILHFKELGLV